MASTELQTVTQATTITHGRCIVVAGTRLYALLNDGTNLVYQYSDDDGATWQPETTIATGVRFASGMYDAVNNRLNICYAGGNSNGFALRFRAITSNVTSGTPGALTTQIDIDAGGTPVGVQYPYMIHSATGTNPRYWIVAKKWTDASTTETRVWYVNVTTATDADTGANWSNANFTNLGTNSNSSDHKFGVATYWTISGNPRVTIVFQSGEGPLDFEAVTFDPTVSSPTPGTVTSDIATHTGIAMIDPNINGSLITINAKADYLVFGRYDPNAGTWSFYKTVDGTTWTTPTGWTGLTMGRCQIAKSGGDFYLLHGSSYDDIATTAQSLLYRKITTSSDTMGATATFSDTNGNGVTVPEDTGTSKLYGMYRGSTGSPYTVRSDYASISVVSEKQSIYFARRTRVRR